MGEGAHGAGGGKERSYPPPLRTQPMRKVKYHYERGRRSEDRKGKELRKT